VGNVVNHDDRMEEYDEQLKMLASITGAQILDLKKVPLENLMTKYTVKQELTPLKDMGKLPFYTVSFQTSSSVR